MNGERSEDVVNILNEVNNCWTEINSTSILGPTRSATVSRLKSRMEELLHKAVENDSITAMNKLGNLYRNHCIPPRYEDALFYYYKAADQGSTEAMDTIAYMSHMGYGRPKDNSFAETYYKKAINSGRYSSCTNLVNMYLNKSGGKENVRRLLDYLYFKLKDADTEERQIEVNRAITTLYRSIIGKDLLSELVNEHVKTI